MSFTFRLYLKRLVALCVCFVLSLCLSSCFVVRDEERVVGSPDHAVVVPSPPEPSANLKPNSTQNIIVTQSPQNSQPSTASEVSTPVASQAPSIAPADSPSQTPETTEAVAAASAAPLPVDDQQIAANETEGESDVADVEALNNEVPLITHEPTIYDNEAEQDKQIIITEENLSAEEPDTTLVEQDYADVPDNADTSDGLSVSIVASIIVLLTGIALHIYKKANFQ